MLFFLGRCLISSFILLNFPSIPQMSAPADTPGSSGAQAQAAPSYKRAEHAFARSPSVLPDQFPSLLPAMTQLMDIDCDCVAHIRKSPCEQALLSAATCHNRVLRTAWRRRVEPDPFECARIFVKLENCMQKYDIPAENPNQKPGDKQIWDVVK